LETIKAGCIFVGLIAIVTALCGVIMYATAAPDPHGDCHTSLAVSYTITSGGAGETDGDYEVLSVGSPLFDGVAAYHVTVNGVAKAKITKILVFDGIDGTRHLFWQGPGVTGMMVPVYTDGLPTGRIVACGVRTS
jgi:hypothetical protein